MSQNITNKEIGYKKEAIATEFLKNKGFLILKSNYIFHHCEIDIIAQKGDCIHFIEVKFRKTNSFGYPESFVSLPQQNRIKSAAENYLYDNKGDIKIMFDIISIEEDNKITFFEDAFF
jgi:putative endonuclease